MGKTGLLVYLYGRMERRWNLVFYNCQEEIAEHSLDQIRLIHNSLSRLHFYNVFIWHRMVIHCVVQQTIFNIWYIEDPHINVRQKKKTKS